MKIDFRSVFVAPKDKLLISVDLSQAESWIVAFRANEHNMKHALLYGDIHLQTAGSALFHRNTGCGHEWIKDERVCKHCNVGVTKDQRYLGKRYNHASSYRMGPIKAAEIINQDSDKPPYITVTVRESKEYSDAWHSYYNVKGWWGEIEAQLNRDRTIATCYGRQRTFYGQWGEQLFREATAYEPQSTVADHFNGAIHPELGIKGGLLGIFTELVEPYWCGMMECTHHSCHKIINQSHDSCILELPKENALDIGKQAMSLLRRPLVVNNEEFTIPVDGEVGERWAEMEKLAA